MGIVCEEIIGRITISVFVDTLMSLRLYFLPVPSLSLSALRGQASD